MVAVYTDVVLPGSIVAAGVRGTTMRKNQRVTTQSGVMQANIQWSRSLRKYELGTVPLSLAQWQTIEGLFEVTDGGAFGFLMLDPKDQTVLTGEGVIQPFVSVNLGTAGFGYGVPTYKTFKRYTSAGSSRTKDRKITRPSTVSILRGGSPVTAGAGAGQYSIDSTGNITFVADASASCSSITMGATTTLNFSVATVAAATTVGDRIYVTNVSGTSASVLNNLSHVVTAKVGNNITISTVTTGLTATGGTGAHYPQPTETLTWTGTFYVPVQFESDHIDFDLVMPGNVEARLIAGPSVVLVEVAE